ncbi:hypothetical protein OG778_23745 [Streptomyces sp. NBC_00184]|uniref:hypothetical protein n=1 Tax=Streptomyces sp. NBC_00184 TaxID=2975673 RepID=UPI002E2E7519|nr:hypothetical protein [Streptomyces sp. NBC_00184]
MMDDDEEMIMPTIGPKTKRFASTHEMLVKLEGRAAMWERVARDNKSRAEDFEDAAQRVRNGSTSVTVGRTTYVLEEEPEGTRDETADRPVS